MLRKDRAKHREAVELQFCLGKTDRCEWQRVRMWAKVFTTNHDYFVPSVYHPPTFDYYETAFIEVLDNSCESILAISPECKVNYCW